MATKHLREYLMVVVASTAALNFGCQKQPTTPAEIMEHSFANSDWETTIAMCDQLLAKNPNDTATLLMRGRAQMCAGDLEPAIRDFSRLIDLQPEDHEGYHYRSMAYRQMGRDELANADGLKAREFDPNFKSAYAYSPSNFQTELDLTPNTELLAEDLKAKEKESDDGEDNAEEADTSDRPNRTPYDQTVFSDETEFEPHETSRVLAMDEPTNEANVAEDAGDIGIPKSPQIGDLVPKLGTPRKAPDGDAKGLAGLEGFRFPATPAADDPSEQLTPEPDAVEPPTQKLSNSLPIDPNGNFFVPGVAQGAMSTGLPTFDASQQGGIRPNGLGTLGPMATGLNAPSTITTGLNAPTANGIGGLSSPFATNLSGFNPNEVGSTVGAPSSGFPPNGSASQPFFDVGLSGLPLPNGSTGLPTALGNSVITPTGTSSDFASRTPNSPTPTQFQGIPIYGQNPASPSPVITSSLPGYPTPNGVVPTNPPPVQQPAISTSLPESVLQNRLSPQPGVGTAPQLRSLQPQ